VIVATLLVMAIHTTAPAYADSLSSTFTYQGQLRQGGNPVNQTCDFQFTLWDAAGGGLPPAGGNQIGSLQPAAGVFVSEGLFTVVLGFGVEAFKGDERWLQVTVRCPDGSGPYTTLAPRQRLSASPYALYAPVAGSAADLTCSGCVAATDLANGAVTSSQIANGTIQKSNLAFTPGSVTQVTAGPGLTGGTITTTGTIAADIGTTPGTVAAGDHTHAATYWKLSGNADTTLGKTSFLGTTYDAPLDLRVNNARALRLQPGTVPSLIGGWSGNHVVEDPVGVVIAGGGTPNDGLGNAAPNTAADNYGVVGGGIANLAGSADGDPAAGAFATVAGGLYNTASAVAASVSGGFNNMSDGSYAAVGGGSGPR
jgi:hypothetical protein